MNCSEEYLVTQLKEMHEYHWKLSRKLHAGDSKSPDHAYEAGKADGSLEAVDAILLAVIGPRKLYEILEKGWNGVY